MSAMVVFGEWSRCPGANVRAPLLMGPNSAHVTESFARNFAVVSFIAEQIVDDIDDDDTTDYCPSEHFNVTCAAPDDVILMEHARYGRMRSGRCVSGHHGVIGCAVDVLTFFDRKCSGRTRCTVYVADPALQKLEPCSKDFTSYLEAKYTCLSGNSTLLSFGVAN